MALIRPTVGKIVLKNVRELAAHLLSTARDHDHIESRLQAIRHAFIQSSENLSVPVTVVGNDQWFYSWLETARVNEKEKIFPIRVDKSLNPKSTVDLVPVLTEKLERIFQSLHADDAGECEKTRLTTFEYVVSDCVLVNIYSKSSFQRADSFQVRPRGERNSREITADEFSPRKYGQDLTKCSEGKLGGIC